MPILTYQCCFCGEVVGTGSAGGHDLDPCAVVLIGNWSAPDHMQLSQQFFCHLACFKQKITDHRLVDIDQMSPGDQA
jgi:hypothetical protein